MSTAKRSTTRRFTLLRTVDVSGTSGTGDVAEGIEYSDGSVAFRCISHLQSHCNYANVKTVLEVHGHDGKTTLKWIDPPHTITEPELPEPTTQELRLKAREDEKQCTYCPPHRGENATRKGRHPTKPKAKDHR